MLKEMQRKLWQVGKQKKIEKAKLLKKNKKKEVKTMAKVVTGRQLEDIYLDDILQMIQGSDNEQWIKIKLTGEGVILEYCNFLEGASETRLWLYNQPIKNQCKETTIFLKKFTI